MATRAIDKPSALGDITDFPNAAGIGYYGGILWVNGDGGAVPVGGVAPAQVFVVNEPLNALNPSGGIYATVQAAVDASELVDDGVPVEIVLTAGEYDEDVEITRSKTTIRGAGPLNSCRITGVATGSGGTATGLKLTGVSDVAVVNLNLEGRTGGSGLHMSGQIRRVSVMGCKLHGGTQAVLLDSDGGGQIVDIRFQGCTIANAATGIFLDYNGGDPCHQIKLLGNIFEKIVTDCVVENGATHDWLIVGNSFGVNDTAESTRFLDIDSVGTTGFVQDNRFATTVFDAAKMAIASGVLWVDNKVEAENPGLAAYGTGGRPD
jgi:pectin methylesterase-like acyl-CoA thioesterase